MSQFILFIKRFSFSAIIGSSLGFLFVGYVVYAQFQPPAAAPPGANVAVPLNVGDIGQIKEGGLTLGNSLLPTDSGLIVIGGRVGIGTQTPDSILNIVGSNRDVGHYSYYGDSSDPDTPLSGADYEFYRARGTEASPARVVGSWPDGDFDKIGSIRFYGWTGTKFSIGAQIRVRADGSVGSVPDDMAMQLEFRTKPNVSGDPVGQLTTRMLIDDNGNIGINDTTPSFKLDVNGSLRAFGITNSSDVRLKRDIDPIGNALDSVLQLRGIYYQWIDEQYGTGLQMGLIGQEVEQIFPEVVDTDEEGFKSIQYGKLTAALIEAIKEQQIQIDQLRAELDELRGQIQ